MAWTTPRTWVTSEVVSASIMNTHVRDDFNETAPAKATAAGLTVWSTAANAIAMVPGAKYKTADETVNNSTTLQNDDHLAFAIAANEVWAFRMFLYITIASGNPGLKYAFTVPASCTGYYHRHDLIGAVDTELTGTSMEGRFSATLTTSVGLGYSGITAFSSQFWGVIINAANAGTIQFQWAQNTAVASDMKLKLGSYMDLKRLA